MNIGRLNQRITLQEPVREPDKQGGRGKKYEDVVTVWAEFRKPKRQISAVNGGVAAELEFEIGIRHRSDVRRGWRVIYKQKTFEVLDTYKPSRETTILICRELVR